MSETQEKFLNIPGITIYRTLVSIINFLRTNLKENEDNIENSYLYKIAGKESSLDGRIDYFKEIQKIFTYKNDDPRFIKIVRGFDLQATKPVTLCVTHSGEQQAAGNGLGMDEDFHGVYENEFVDEEGTTKYSYNHSYTRRYSATYQIIIVTDNSDESELIYQILKTMFISFTQHLSFLGLANLKIGGQDLMIKQDHMPKYLSNKIMTLAFEYESHSLDIHETPQIMGIIFKGIMKDK